LFQAFWLYGAVEPATGEHFFLEFSHVDTDCFQSFLVAFAQTYSDSINVLQVDRGRLHTAKRLQVPENVILLFQPPYCPELNPIERLWQYLKQDLRWQSFQNLDQLWDRLTQLLAALTLELVASITGFPFILDALSVADLI
jgi:transposase